MSQHPNSSSSCTNQFSRRKPDSVTPPLFLTLASRPASVNTLLLRAPRCSSLCPHSWGRPHHASLLRSRRYEDEPGPHWDRLLPQCWALSLSELTGSAHEGHKIYSGGFIYMDKKCNWFRDLQLDSLILWEIETLHLWTELDSQGGRQEDSSQVMSRTITPKSRVYIQSVVWFGQQNHSWFHYVDKNISLWKADEIQSVGFGHKLSILEWKKRTTGAQVPNTYILKFLLNQTQITALPGEWIRFLGFQWGTVEEETYPLEEELQTTASAVTGQLQQHRFQKSDVLKTVCLTAALKDVLVPSSRYCSDSPAHQMSIQSNFRLIYLPAHLLCHPPSAPHAVFCSSLSAAVSSPPTFCWLVRFWC